jgi:ribosome-associated protein
MTKIEIVIKALEDINAFDVIAFDTKGKSPFFDHFVIASVTSDRQLQAAINHISEDFRENSHKSPKVEGKNSKSWVLIDCGDVIVNVFTREERDFYNMEKMWVGTEQLDLDKDNDL